MIVRPVVGVGRPVGSSDESQTRSGNEEGSRRIGERVGQCRPVRGTTHVGARHVHDERAVRSGVEGAADGVATAVRVRAHVERPVAELRDGPPAGTRGGCLREPPRAPSGGVGAAGLLPVDGPQPRQDVRVVCRGRRFEVLGGERHIDVGAARGGSEERVLDVEVVHVLSRAPWVVVRGVVHEVHDLRAGARAPLWRSDRRRWRNTVVHERRSGRCARTGALPREVQDRAPRSRVVVRVGDVRRAVGRVNRDLEEVEQRAITGRGAQIATQTVDADRARVDGVIARLEHAPRRAAVDRLSHVDVPHVVGIVLRVRLRARPAGCPVEHHVGDAGSAGGGPRHDGRVHAGRVGDL